MCQIQYVLVVANEAAEKFINEVSRRGMSLGVAVYVLSAGKRHYHDPRYKFKAIFITGESGVRFMEEILQTRPNQDEILSGLSVNQPLPRLVGRLLPKREQPAKPEVALG
ncbi:MAG: hypothetical protein HYT13_01135 [Candidatus Liptonbacteria bacterium]|nr:hypothetical protein [Candidatus Liptonbacteria bacterium]